MGLQLSHGEGRTMDDDARAHIEGEISHIKWQCGLIRLPKTEDGFTLTTDLKDDLDC